ncbi:sortase, partial [candidate division WWE3 bacterium]|nr:sortase [candidate division WWE3 bacterium]
LVDSLNKIHEYKVTKTFYVDINDPERLTIFEDVTDKSELTLITCGGVWDVRIGTYNKRLVVKADYVEDAESRFVSN